MGYTRQMPQIVRDKISSKLTGRTLSDETKQRISDGLKQAWSRIPLNTTNSKEENHGTKD